MTRINGDLVPSASGQAHLGVNGSATDAFDIASISPFGHIHQNSGVFHDPLSGQSGVLRYSQAAGAFQVSIDGGWTFTNLSTSTSSGSGLNSINGDLGPNISLVGVSGIQVTALGNGTILIGTSGQFLTSQSGVLAGTGGVTVQQIGGNFVISMTPDGSGLHSLNGETGPDVTLIGDTFSSITVPSSNHIKVNIDPSGIMDSRKYVEAFTSLTNYALGAFRTFTHGLGTYDVVVQTYDTSAPNGKLIMPDDIVIEDENSVTVYYNAQTAGRVVIIG